MCSASRLIVLYICVKLHENIKQTWVIVEMAIFNIYYVQRTATPKGGLPKLHFLYSAHCLMVLHICEKFHNISNGFQVTEQTLVHGRNGYI